MSKGLKICLGIVALIILLIGADVVSIKLREKPLFAISRDVDDGIIYKGLLYDTYVCDSLSTVKINPKWSEFQCLAIYNTLEDDENGWYDGWYEDELNEVEGVTLEIKEGTLTNKGVTIIITDNNTNKYTFEEEYRIDIKVDGRWKQATIVNLENYYFNELGYLVDKNNQLEMVVNWEPIYGILANGEYRIVKSIYDYEEQKGLYFSKEFIIDNM